MATVSGEGVRVQVKGLPQLRTALRNYAPAANKNFQKRLKVVAVAVAAGAKVRAGWSRRIPRAIFAGVQNKGPYVRVAGKVVPYAPLYEGEEGSSGFRHPLFGDRNHWYQQATRPFVRPEVQARQAMIQAEAILAVEAAKQEVGL